MWKSAEEFLSKDRYIGLLIKKYGPCKIEPRKKSMYFEHLLSSITNQQLSGKAAETIFNRVKERCDGKISPEKIIELQDEELRRCGLSWAKVSYVKDLAERVINSKLKINSLDKLSDEEVLNELISVKGIGRWTAEMFLMFTLARADIFPADDLGIKNGVKKLTSKEMKPKELAKFGERFKPFRTAAAWYIWASLDNRD